MLQINGRMIDLTETGHMHEEIENFHPETLTEVQTLPIYASIAFLLPGEVLRVNSRMKF